MTRYIEMSDEERSRADEVLKADIAYVLGTGGVVSAHRLEELQDWRRMWREGELVRAVEKLDIPHAGPPWAAPGYRDACDDLPVLSSEEAGKIKRYDADYAKGVWVECETIRSGTGPDAHAEQLAKEMASDDTWTPCIGPKAGEVVDVREGPSMLDLAKQSARTILEAPAKKLDQETKRG